MGDWKRKPDKKSIDEKLPKLDEEIWEENQKIVVQVLSMKKPSNLNQNREGKTDWLINGKTLETNDKNKGENQQID